MKQAIVLIVAMMMAGAIVAAIDRMPTGPLNRDIPAGD